MQTVYQELIRFVSVGLDVQSVEHTGEEREPPVRVQETSQLATVCRNPSSLFTVQTLA